MNSLPKIPQLSNPQPGTSLEDVLDSGVSPEIVFELLKKFTHFLARQNRELAAQLKVTERRLLLSRQALALIDVERRGVVQ